MLLYKYITSSINSSTFLINRQKCQTSHADYTIKAVIPWLWRAVGMMGWDGSSKPSGNTRLLRQVRISGQRRFFHAVEIRRTGTGAGCQLESIRLNGVTAFSMHVGAAFIKALVSADAPARTRRGSEMSGTGERGSSGARCFANIAL